MAFGGGVAGDTQKLEAQVERYSPPEPEPITPQRIEYARAQIGSQYYLTGLAI